MGGGSSNLKGTRFVSSQLMGETLTFKNANCRGARFKNTELEYLHPQNKEVELRNICMEINARGGKYADEAKYDCKQVHDSRYLTYLKDVFNQENAYILDYHGFLQPHGKFKEQIFMKKSTSISTKETKHFLIKSL